jgi:hypothetical protein
MVREFDGLHYDSVLALMLMDSDIGGDASLTVIAEHPLINVERSIGLVVMQMPRSIGATNGVYRQGFV